MCKNFEIITVNYYQYDEILSCIDLENIQIDDIKLDNNSINTFKQSTNKNDNNITNYTDFKISENIFLLINGRRKLGI